VHVRESRADFPDGSGLRGAVFLSNGLAGRGERGRPESDLPPAARAASRRGELMTFFLVRLTRRTEKQQQRPSQQPILTGRTSIQTSPGNRMPAQRGIPASVPCHGRRLQVWSDAASELIAPFTGNALSWCEWGQVAVRDRVSTPGPEQRAFGGAGDATPRKSLGYRSGVWYKPIARVTVAYQGDALDLRFRPDL